MTEEEKAQQQVDDWNRTYYAGTPVVAYGAGQPFRAVTTTGAVVFRWDKRFAVVRIHPCPPNSGPFWLLDNLKPVEENTDGQENRQGDPETLGTGQRDQ